MTKNSAARFQSRPGPPQGGGPVHFSLDRERSGGVPSAKGNVTTYGACGVCAWLEALTFHRVASLTEDATSANIKLRRLNQKYKKFSKAAGLPEQRDRMKVLYPDQQSFQTAATKILERSEEKYGIGLTMSANDGILSEKDVYAIDQYKKSGVSFPLNYALRSGLPLTDTQQKFTHDLDQALLKLPTYQGTVYRSLTIDMMEDLEGFKKRYVPDSIVIEPAFTSSSAGGVYDESMDIQMIIQSKHGRDMRIYNPLEQEVLFRRGSMFIVDKVEGNTIWLTEA